ncbi:hypothetical protein JCM17823_05270 [Halorubrum gandharaense]
MSIVVAIDEGDHAARNVEEGADLARAYDEPLHVIFVYEQSEHRRLANQYIEMTEDVTTEQAQELAERVISEATDGITDEYVAVGRVGEPAAEILEYAEEVDARYLVVGGRSRSPVGKALFGSVTQSLLLEANRPVLAVMTEE